MNKLHVYHHQGSGCGGVIGWVILFFLAMLLCRLFS